MEPSSRPAPTSLPPVDCSLASPAAPAPLVGRVRVPGDKSCTQRALLLGAVADGETVVRGALAAGDTLATAAIVAQLGARVVWAADGERVAASRQAGGAQGDGAAQHEGDAQSAGARAPRGSLSITGTDAPLSPDAALDCANAGTAARLLLGLLAGYPGRWLLDGDSSLRRRPMARVTAPLRAMGAALSGDRLPLTLRGAGAGPRSDGGSGAGARGGAGPGLRGMRHEIAVPSAQVKSALLLAGLRAEGPTTVVQHSATRDHTERMLAAFGVRVDVEPGEVCVHPARPRAAMLDIPGDPSSAAFLIVASLLVPGSDVWVTDVGLWPRRTGFLRALERAGADIMVLRRDEAGRNAAAANARGAAPRDPARGGGGQRGGDPRGGDPRGGDPRGGDPRGDVRAGHSDLSAFDIAPEDVPDLVDEIPILALAAACARGTSRFFGLAELRLKESDRIAGVAALLAAFGVPVEIGDDSLAITGVPALRSPAWLPAASPAAAPAASRSPTAVPATRWPGLDDHRLALTAVVACASSGFPLPPHAAADVSFPGFAALLASLCATHQRR